MLPQLPNDGVLLLLVLLDFLLQLLQLRLLLLVLQPDLPASVLEEGDPLLVGGKFLGEAGSTCCSASIFLARERCSFSLLRKVLPLDDIRILTKKLSISLRLPLKKAGLRG